VQRFAHTLVFVSTLALGCARAVPLGSAAAGSAAEPRWGAAQSAALDAQIAAIEERLLAQQARVAFWQEMRTRHESVTAVACENLAEHAEAMRAGATRFQVRLADQRHRRVAAAGPVTQ
jgi:hypothetical protein